MSMEKKRILAVCLLIVGLAILPVAGYWTEQLTICWSMKVGYPVNVQIKEPPKKECTVPQSPETVPMPALQAPDPAKLPNNSPADGRGNSGETGGTDIPTEKKPPTADTEVQESQTEAPKTEAQQTPQAETPQTPQAETPQREGSVRDAET
jgi:uncharacterized iron-regulated membrane protein